MHEVIKYVRYNYSNPDLSAIDIAQATHYSRRQVFTIFKRELNMTPGEFIAKLRLNRARRLLAHTELPCNEIIRSIGYQSRTNFHNLFKSSTGMTMLECRKKLAKPNSKDVYEQR